MCQICFFSIFLWILFVLPIEEIIKIDKTTYFLFNSSKLVSYVDFAIKKVISQWAFTCSKLTIETLEQGVKYVQS